jgi:hypothetical protein
MTCVPSLPPSMFAQTRETLHEFCCYLAKLKGQSGDLDWLCKRLVKSNVLLQPVRELPVVSELSCDGREQLEEDT